MDKEYLLDLLDNLDNPKPDTFPNSNLNKHSRVMLVDGMNLFIRNFAILNYLNKDGIHIGGLVGFLRSLGSLIKLIKPTSIYVVFDGEGSSTNRKNLVPEYKSNRNLAKITNWDMFETLDEEEDSKFNQISRLVHYLRCLPIKIISQDKTEADDVISYLALNLDKNQNSKVIIVSSDEDFLQLANQNISIYRPVEKKFYNPNLVKEKFGVLVENFIIYKTLVGDNSDVVKGLRGMGKKRIIKLFPELTQQKLKFEDIFNISEVNIKLNKAYPQILLERDTLENYYKIMNLSNPLIHEGGKKDLDNLIKARSFNYKPQEFIKLYNEDNLNNSIREVNLWLSECFGVLSSFNK